MKKHIIKAILDSNPEFWDALINWLKTKPQFVEKYDAFVTERKVKLQEEISRIDADGEINS